ncbi:ankyrin repeat-containing domain protein [Aspergillus germanicus]
MACSGIEVLSCLVDAGATLSSYDSSNLIGVRSLIFHAFMEDRVDIAKWLLEPGKSGITHKALSPLHLAIIENESKIVEWILQLVGDLTSIVGDEKWLLALNNSTWGSPLAHTARLGRLDMVKALMQHGANVNDSSPFANTNPPLAAAIDGTCLPEMLNFLVESGARVDLTLDIWNSLFSKLLDAHGPARPLIEKILSSANISEPIHNLLILVISDCMMQCRQQLIKSLIDKGADIHGVDSFGRTCLHWAALVGDVWTTELLLGLGARQDVRDKLGNTARLLAYRGISHD